MSVVAIALISGGIALLGDSSPYQNELALALGYFFGVTVVLSILFGRKVFYIATGVKFDNKLAKVSATAPNTNAGAGTSGQAEGYMPSAEATSLLKKGTQSSNITLCMTELDRVRAYIELVKQRIESVREEISKWREILPKVESGSLDGLGMGGYVSSYSVRVRDSVLNQDASEKEDEEFVMLAHVTNQEIYDDDE